MAGANTSLAQAEDAVGFNPAGLSKLEKARSISGTIRRHLLDVTSGNVTYAFPGAGRINYAVSMAYVNYGRITELDEDGQETGAEIIASSFSPSLTASGRLSDKLRLGATVKAASEYLGDFEESRLGLGWGLDAGMLYQPAARNLGFGVSLLNLGLKTRSQMEGGEAGGLLPTALKGGFYYHPLGIPKGRVSVDLELPWNDSPLLAGGIEYAYSSSLVLRTGTRVNYPEVKRFFEMVTDQADGDFLGGNALKLAGGFTFLVEGVALDYAAQYWQGLSWVHALTLRYAVM